jgi:hypothetical protein
MMDTSETYFKMCEKAKEIQKIHEYEDGSYEAYIYNGKLTVSLICIGCDYEHGCTPDFVPGGIWLPRQDQLQGMIDWNKDFLTLDKVRLFYEFTKQIDWKHRLFHSSIEQLWLAFVMEEKYNKVWTGNDWEAR